MGKPHSRSWSTEPGQAVGAHTLSDRNPDLPPLRVVWMDDIVSEWNKKRARNEQQLQYETQASVRRLLGPIPLRVHSVSIKGVKQTRTPFLEGIISSAARDVPKDPSTLDEVRHLQSLTVSRLEQTEIFSSIIPTLEPGPDEDSVKVVFVAREKGRLVGKAGTEFGDNNEGTASLSGRFSNIFGGAESLTANLATGTATRKNTRLVFTAPLTSDIKTWGEISAFQSDSDHTTYASCMEGLSGVQLALKRGNIQSGLSQFAYEYTNRHLHSLTPTASFTIRNSTTPTTQSSLSHTFTYDSRNDPFVPTHGLKFWAKQELSLPALASSAAFFKSELQTATGRSLALLGLPSVTVSTSLKAGFLHSLAADRTTHFCDRFQVGGPNSVRMFRYGGIGARDGADSMGSTIYYSFGASLISPLPLPLRTSPVVSPTPTSLHLDGPPSRPVVHISAKPNKEALEPTGWKLSATHDYPLYLHWWVNGGRGVGGPTESAIQRIQEHGPSLSAGVGILWRFNSQIRAELNFGVPLMMSKGENSRKGLQGGVGIEFS